MGKCTYGPAAVLVDQSITEIFQKKESPNFHEFLGSPPRERWSSLWQKTEGATTAERGTRLIPFSHGGRRDPFSPLSSVLRFPLRGRPDTYCLIIRGIEEPRSINQWARRGMREREIVWGGQWMEPSTLCYKSYQNLDGSNLLIGNQCHKWVFFNFWRVESNIWSKSVLHESTLCKFRIVTSLLCP